MVDEVFGGYRYFHVCKQPASMAWVLNSLAEAVSGTSLSAEEEATLAFMKTLDERMQQNFAKHTRVVGPIVSISESTESFLTDAIATQNKQFADKWPAGKEFSEGPLLDAFVALVTTTLKLDPALQVRVDQLVPRKASEAVFVRDR